MSKEKNEDEFGKMLKGAISCGMQGNRMHVTYENGNEKRFVFEDGKWKDEMELMMK